jgi:uncharacterized protein
MRTLLLIALLFVGHILPAQYIKDRPRPARVVNDYGNFLTYSQERSLENELISYRKRSGNAIVIITLNTLPYSVEETALRYFNKWGIGDRIKNNGVLILASQSPRRVRITTGAGIDHLLTNDDCQRIIDETLVPNFRAGSFYTGFEEAVTDIKRILGGGGYTGGVHSSGGGMQANNGLSVADVPQSQPEVQPQPQTQYTPSTYQRKPLTLGEAIGGLLSLTLMVWLRVKYVRSKRPAAETFSTEGYDGPSSNHNGAQDYFNAIGWVLLLVGKIVMWTCIFTFGLLAMMFGLGRGRSLFGSSGAGGSFGGGVSRGGGASGSW